MKNLNWLLAAGCFLPLLGGEPGKTEIMNQGFEQKESFEKLSPNGYTLSRKAPGGQWGFFKADKVMTVTEAQAASGSRSLAYTAQKKTPYYGVGIFPSPVKGSLELELWVYRERGFNGGIGLVSRKNGKAERLASVGTFDKSHQFAFLDSDGKWKRSGILCPAEEWVKLVLFYDRVRNGCSYSVILNDKREEIGWCQFKEPVGEILFFELRPNGAEPGSSLYLDDVKAYEIPVKN